MTMESNCCHNSFIRRTFALTGSTMRLEKASHINATRNLLNTKISVGCSLAAFFDCFSPLPPLVFRQLGISGSHEMSSTNTQRQLLVQECITSSPKPDQRLSLFTQTSVYTTEQRLSFTMHIGFYGSTSMAVRLQAQTRPGRMTGQLSVSMTSNGKKEHRRGEDCRRSQSCQFADDSLRLTTCLEREMSNNAVTSFRVVGSPPKFRFNADDCFGRQKDSSLRLAHLVIHSDIRGLIDSTSTVINAFFFPCSSIVKQGSETLSVPRNTISHCPLDIHVSTDLLTSIQLGRTQLVSRI